MKGKLVSGDPYINALRSRTLRKNGELISFPEVSRILSYWRFQKTERDELIRSWEESGKIRVVNYKGIIIKGGKLR